MTNTTTPTPGFVEFNGPFGTDSFGLNPPSWYTNPQLKLDLGNSFNFGTATPPASPPATPPATPPAASGGFWSNVFSPATVSGFGASFANSLSTNLFRGPSLNYGSTAGAFTTLPDMAAAANVGASLAMGEAARKAQDAATLDSLFKQGLDTEIAKKNATWFTQASRAAEAARKYLDIQGKPSLGFNDVSLASLGSPNPTSIGSYSSALPSDANPSALYKSVYSANRA